MTEDRDRFARWVASPASVLVVIPVLVIGVGLAVLLLGQHATRATSEAMARHQLVQQADEVAHDVDVALAQADPVLATLHGLSSAALDTPEAMQRLHDAVIGRPGIANAAISFPSGALWNAFYTPDRALHTGDQTEDHTHREWSFEGGPHTIATSHSTYDPRTRPHYIQAIAAKHRVWLPPHTFSTSHKTGITVSEPAYAADGSLAAVLTIDYNVDELSHAMAQPPVEGARTIVFAPDGTILASPGTAIPDVSIKEARLLRYGDFHDPALDALFAVLGTTRVGAQEFLTVVAKDGRYLASVAPVGVAGAPGSGIDWELATLVPERALFGTSRRFSRDAIIASAGALLIALGVGILFAWNLVRMRRAVGQARAEAKSAKQRAEELGSYRLVAKLGAGGMGEVWRAEHQLLARAAAIKLVRREALADPGLAALVQERFRREAQTLATLRSRHTIALYDYGVTADGSFFFVMELLEGLDLSQLVREHGPQPAARVIHLLMQACASLAEAHDAGLLHRDIKPANLFVSRAADEVDILKLLDFGIAHNLADPSTALIGLPSGDPGSSGERLTAVGSIVGTPGYVPPEQITGSTLDARGDLYALGCVAWYLLTGDEVYPGFDADALFRVHATLPVPNLRTRVHGWLPEGLETLIASCLAKSPDERPADARALADALGEIEIPPEQAWTKQKAKAWWQNLQTRVTSSPDAPTAEPPRLTRAPGHGEAATVTARPRRSP